MSGLKLAVKLNHDVRVVDTDNCYMTTSVVMMMKANILVDRKGLHGHDVTSILVKCSRDEVTGT